MTDDSDGETPPMWIRVVGIVGAAWLAGYCATGVWHDDLLVSLSKSSRAAGVHLHGFLAWLCFAGAVLFSIGLVGFLAPQFDGGEYDRAARRRRFGPIMLVGLVCYVVPQLIVGLRS